MSFSRFGHDPPPSRALTPKGIKHTQPKAPVKAEPDHGGTPTDGAPSALAEASIHHSAHAMHQSNSTGSDEDARFLRLAHEALVATSTESNLIVDPTIQDLLTRLQYVQSPHGNPIRRSQEIRSNAHGQLMIQDFYTNFPNLGRNVFQEEKELSAENLSQQHSHRDIPSHQHLHGQSNLHGLLDPPSKESLHNQPNMHQEQHPDSQIAHVSNLKSQGWDFLGNSVDASSANPLDVPAVPVGLKRNFPCRDCTMSFRRSSDLKRHEKQHLAIPANICSACGKGFARRDALKRHRGTLTCKRNADKDLYAKNLEYKRERQEPDETKMEG